MRLTERQNIQPVIERTHEAFNEILQKAETLTQSERVGIAFIVLNLRSLMDSWHLSTMMLADRFIMKD